LNDDIYIIGASGHGREVLWLLRRLDSYRIRGFVDDNAELHGREICDLEVLGPLSFLEDVGPASVALGIGLPRVKEVVLDKLSHLPLKWPALVDPSVEMSEYVQLGRGVTVCAGSVLTTQVDVGDFALINVGCTISHDATVGKGAMISPGCHLAGNVTVGDWANLGTGTDVIPGVTVGDGAVVGAGATVIDDVPAGVTAVGTPARVVETAAVRDGG